MGGTSTSPGDSDSKEGGAATGRAHMAMATPVGLGPASVGGGIPGPTPRRRPTVTATGSDLPSLGSLPSSPLPSEGLVFAFPCSPRDAGLGSLRASPLLPDPTATSRQCPSPLLGVDGPVGAGGAFKPLPTLPVMATARSLLAGQGPSSAAGGPATAVGGMGSPMTMG
jgi:hypothetical protein